MAKITNAMNDVNTAWKVMRMSLLLLFKSHFVSKTITHKDNKNKEKIIEWVVYLDANDHWNPKDRLESVSINENITGKRNRKFKKGPNLNILLLTSSKRTSLSFIRIKIANTINIKIKLFIDKSWGPPSRVDRKKGIEIMSNLYPIVFELMTWFWFEDKK